MIKLIIINIHKRVLTIYLITISMIGCSEAQDNTKINWKETIGVVSGVPKNRHILYKVNNKVYLQGFKHSLYGMVYEDEKYLLKYDSINPEHIQVCYACPVFLRTEKTQIFPARVLKIINYRWPFGHEYSVRFEYNIYGVYIMKEQDIPVNYNEIFPGLMEGQYYEVECWVDGAQRAIIHLDRPYNRKKE